MPLTSHPPGTETGSDSACLEDAAEQRNLLGVSRIYAAALPDAHRTDTPRLMFGRLYVPLASTIQTSIAYISRQALERALWEFRTNPRFLKRERSALLRQLRFDTDAPYFVRYDTERQLYAFHPGAPIPAG